MSSPAAHHAPEGWPPEVFDAVVEALADALVADYRAAMVHSPGSTDHRAHQAGPEPPQQAPFSMARGAQIHRLLRAQNLAPTAAEPVRTARTTCVRAPRHRDHPFHAIVITCCTAS